MIWRETEIDKEIFSQRFKTVNIEAETIHQKIKTCIQIDAESIIFGFLAFQDVEREE